MTNPSPPTLALPFRALRPALCAALTAVWIGACADPPHEDLDLVEPAAESARTSMPAPLVEGAAARAATVELPARAGGAARVEDETSHVAVSFALRGASDVEVEVASGLAVYRGAFGGADVVYKTHSEGTEDFVLFDAPPDREEIAYDVDVSRAAGLRLVADTLELLDEAGTPRLRVAPPYVVDARGERRPATLTVEGCAFDPDPRAPWGRPVTPAGAATCAVRVAWSGAPYPLIVDPSWTTTGSMAVARSHHTATSLASGKVLLTGGENANDLSSAELFDPVTGTFAAAGSMTAARTLHAATLLASGKVLVTGGESGSAFSTAEVYDPDTGTFVGTGALEEGRHNHTATLLGSGEVLIAGGEWGLPLFSAYLYHEAPGTFSTPDSIDTARRSHTATLLGSGRVLLAGGFDDGGAGSSAEIYDPATATFSATGPMVTARGSHTATLLGSGTVLVAGGVGASQSHLATAERYDPATGMFASTGSMPAGRKWHSATLLGGGEVLVVGGTLQNGGPNTLLYDPGTGTFAPADPPATTRAWHTATLLGSGRVLVAGGISPANYQSSAELYNLLPGRPCAAAGECASGACNDGVCCATACAPATCSTCAAGTGACLTITSAEDPDTCAGTSACDAAGACKKKLGQPCPGGDVECLSGSCSDGVCCDAACSGACDTCAAALGAPADGTCALLSSRAICRPESGDCDVPEACDGASPDCPADAAAPDGTACPGGLCSGGACLGGTGGQGGAGGQGAGGGQAGSGGEGATHDQGGGGGEGAVDSGGGSAGQAVGGGDGTDPAAGWACRAGAAATHERASLAFAGLGLLHMVLAARRRRRPEETR